MAGPAPIGILHAPRYPVVRRLAPEPAREIFRSPSAHRPVMLYSPYRCRRDIGPDSHHQH